MNRQTMDRQMKMDDGVRRTDRWRRTEGDDGRQTGMTGQMDRGTGPKKATATKTERVGTGRQLGRVLHGGAPWAPIPHLSAGKSRK